MQQISYIAGVLKVFRDFQHSATRFFSPICMALGMIFFFFLGCTPSTKKIPQNTAIQAQDTAFGPLFTEDTIIPPDTSTIPEGYFGDLVRYGRKIVLETPKYIGPKGIAGQYTGNLMTCQNCHLQAGTKNFGINFLTTHARYPQYRARENAVLSIQQRVNNCVERPHSGKPLPLDSKEMMAIVSYIQWLGQGSVVGQRRNGDGYLPFEWTDQAADRENGAKLYVQHCATCHQPEGQGLLADDGAQYKYPPLWGLDSYQPGSSMHRVTKAAMFIKANMPFETHHWSKPVLTDQECIDLAAFINDDDLHKRPHNPKYKGSYPDIHHKPIGFDRGPYVDPFSEEQHKYGPYGPIIDWYKEKGIPYSL